MSAADDAVAWANAKLQGDWSAVGVAGQLTQQKLRDLLPVFSKGKLDNMVKVRLLMACLFLPRYERLQMEDELSRLASLATCDDDEWVKVMGLAVGPNISGRLDMEAVLNGNHVVSETVYSIWKLMDDIEQPPGDFLPLQEMYMHPDVRVNKRGPPIANHGHFVVADDPESQCALPNFDLSALVGGSEASSTYARTGTAGVHSRRGMMGLSQQSDMFRPSRPTETMPQLKVSTAKEVGVGVPGTPGSRGVSGSGGTPSGGGAAMQRTTKARGLELSEVVGLQERQLSLKKPTSLTSGGAGGAGAATAAEKGEAGPLNLRAASNSCKDAEGSGLMSPPAGAAPAVELAGKLCDSSGTVDPLSVSAAGTAANPAAPVFDAGAAARVDTCQAAASGEKVSTAEEEELFSPGSGGSSSSGGGAAAADADADARSNEEEELASVGDCGDDGGGGGGGEVGDKQGEVGSRGSGWGGAEGGGCSALTKAKELAVQAAVTTAQDHPDRCVPQGDAPNKAPLATCIATPVQDLHAAGPLPAKLLHPVQLLPQALSHSAASAALTEGRRPSAGFVLDLQSPASATPRPRLPVLDLAQPGSVEPQGAGAWSVPSEPALAKGTPWVGGKRPREAQDEQGREG